VREAKVRDLQNLLGFVVSLARSLADRADDKQKARALVDLQVQLYARQPVGFPLGVPPYQCSSLIPAFLARIRK